MSSELTNLSPTPANLLAGLVATLDAGEPLAVQEYVERIPKPEIPRLITLLDDDRKQILLTILEDEHVAELFQWLDDAHAADLIEDLPVEEAARIVEEMESDHRADVLNEIDDDQAEAILSEMDPEEARDARRLMEYDEDTGGGLMVTEFVQYPQDMKAGDLIADLRDHASAYFDQGIQYIYVCADSGRLVGVIRMRDLLFSSWEAPLSRIMIVNPICVFETTSLDEIDATFERFPFWSLPVLDSEGRMVGVVRRSDIEEAQEEASERTFLRFSGIIGGEEIRSLPLRERAMRRLSWLCVNAVLSLLAASVVLLFEGTINQVFILVFFMPVIANLSGCSGNQAVAVSIRELAVGLIQPQDFIIVWRKEFYVGLINGLAIGGILGLVALILSVTVWHSSPIIGPVIGISFLLNTVIAVSLGGLIPLGLKYLGADAALGAPPILTTLTDMCGFLIVLSLATAAVAMGFF